MRTRAEVKARQRRRAEIGRCATSRPARPPDLRRAVRAHAPVDAGARGERDRVVFLVVDNALPVPIDAAALARFERAVARCAGQALLLLSRGAEVGFLARGVKVAAQSGRSQRLRILEALARLEAVPAASASDFPPLRKRDLRWVVA
jgi:hypothetical protein